MRAARTVALVGLAAVVARAVQRDGWRQVQHDLVDHPLMALWPRAGDHLHAELPNDMGPLWDEVEEVPCIGCGCTESRACAGGCSWVSVDPPVCSQCTTKPLVAFLEDLGAPERRKPTLGGRLPGTGAWVVDDLGPDVDWQSGRPALRDPKGGAWCSWLNLPGLDGLRDQLARGAES